MKPRRRLEAICRAWACCELVAGVLYVVSPEVATPLERAIACADAATRIEMLQLERLQAPKGGSVVPGARCFEEGVAQTLARRARSRKDNGS